MAKKNPEDMPLTLNNLDQVLAKLKDTLKLPPVSVSTAKTRENSVYSSDVKVKPLPLAYVPHDRGRFAECGYDLGEIARAADTEALVRVAIGKHFSLCMKENWTFTGKNPETIEYLGRRLFEIELATGISFESIVRDIFYNIITYSNAFLVMRRDMDLSSGKPIMKFGRELQPIAGFCAADPTSFRIRRNKVGEVKEYWQRIEGDRHSMTAEKYFSPDIVAHFYYCKKTGMAWGTPFIVPVLDDIRMLRNLEEISNLICHKGAFPFYHYQVGTESLPAIDYEDGTSEITDVEGKIQTKSIEGMFVTPERHTITCVDGDAPIRNIQPYIDHFKKRVLAGLNLSSVDVGEGDCYSADTETLTEFGWKKFSEIDITKHKIATFNPKTKNLEYHLPNYQYVAPYKGKMIHFYDKGKIDILVTPHHDMWMASTPKSRRPNKSTDWKKVKAEDYHKKIRTRNYYFKGAVNKAETKTFKLGENLCYDIDHSPWKIVNLAELIVWYCLVGTVVHTEAGKLIVIAHRNPEAIDSVKRTLRALNTPYDYKADELSAQSSIIIRDKYLVDWLILNCRETDKCIPREFILASGNILYRMFKVLTEIHGNGFADTSSKIAARLYINSKRLLDDLQEICFRAGKVVVVEPYAVGDVTSNVLTVLETREEYTKLPLTKITKEVDYDGMIYCYNVPNHLFITRRNGCIAIQGNTANRGTATAMSKSLQYQCKDFQKVVANTFISIFDDLLQEGGFDITPENRVHMSFPEIDIESQQLVNNHALALYQGNAITEDEMRKAMGYEPFKEGQHDTRCLGMVQMPLLELQRQAQASIAAEKASVAASKNKPSNQYGTKASAGSRANDEFISAIIDRILDDVASLVETEDVSNKDKLVNCTALEIDSYLSSRIPNPGLFAAIKTAISPLYAITADTANSILPLIREQLLVAIDTLPEISEKTPEPVEDKKIAMVESNIDVIKGNILDLTNKLDKFSDRQQIINVNVPEQKPQDVKVDVTMPEIKHPPVNIDVNIPEQKQPEINITMPKQDSEFRPNITVEAPVVNIQPPNIQVNLPEVAAPVINQTIVPMPAPNVAVNVDPSTIIVPAPQVTINNPQPPERKIKLEVVKNGDGTIAGIVGSSSNTEEDEDETEE